MDVELGFLTPEYRAFVHVESAGTHVSNFDWGDQMSGVRQMIRFSLFCSLFRIQAYFSHNSSGR
jgi:hypothetical protein